MYEVDAEKGCLLVMIMVKVGRVTPSAGSSGFQVSLPTRRGTYDPGFLHLHAFWHHVALVDLLLKSVVGNLADP